MNKSFTFGVMLILAAFSAFGKVSEQQAKQLGERGELTPSGAVWNGNTAGSIPEWAGSKCFEEDQLSLSYAELERAWPDPDLVDLKLGKPIDKPLFTIHASNAHEHRDKLTAGHIKLLKTRGASFRMHVYPSQRCHFNLPETDSATRANATATELKGTDGISGHRLGVPFPIPSKGAEVIWNHKLRHRGIAYQRRFTEAVVNDEGYYKLIKISQDALFKYSNPKFPPWKYASEQIGFTISEVLGQPKHTGRLTLIHDIISPKSGGRKRWRYSPGWGRVHWHRKFGYGWPTLFTDKIQFNDEDELFNGALDYFNWTLLGKKEMYIAYNNHELANPRHTYGRILGKGHLDAELLRYELHRVWVVEATLKSGKEHGLAKRIYYADEDSWHLVAVEGYDNAGKLKKFQEAYLRTLAFVPVTNAAVEIVHDFDRGRYFATLLANEEAPPNYDIRFKPEVFQPSRLKRRMSHRRR